MASQKNVFILLGNGFSIDMMKTIGKSDVINLNNLLGCPVLCSNINSLV